MFFCDLKQLNPNCVQEGSRCCVSFINRRFSPHTAHHTVPIVLGPAEKLWTLRSNPGIITQYYSWSPGELKKNFLGMLFFPLHSACHLNPSKSCFINSEQIKMLFNRKNTERLKSVESFPVVSRLVNPLSPQICIPLCRSWSCVLCTQTCVHIHKETHTQAHLQPSWSKGHVLTFSSWELVTLGLWVKCRNIITRRPVQSATQCVHNSETRQPMNVTTLLRQPGPLSPPHTGQTAERLLLEVEDHSGVSSKALEDPSSYHILQTDSQNILDTSRRLSGK